MIILVLYSSKDYTKALKGLRGDTFFFIIQVSYTGPTLSNERKQSYSTNFKISLFLQFNLKSGSYLPKNFCHLIHWKPFTNDEKCFVFHLKSSFRCQDI